MGDLFWPFDISTVTDWAGSIRAGGVIHMGTDFGVPNGTPLRATISGRIVRINDDGLGGYVLDIVRADGLVVRNAHLSRMDVNTGDIVTAGQVIGLTGGIPGTPGAGNTNGAHLHWELRWDRLWRGGSWFDPRIVGVESFTTFAAFGMKVIEPKPRRETEMLIVRHVERDRFYAVGQQYLKSYKNPVAAQVAADWLQDGKVLDINNPSGAVSILLETFSIPQNVWEGVTGGETWSASSDALTKVASLTGLSVNVDAIASAVASKVGTTSSGNIPATKAKLLELIEANYPEGK
jgi:hypothetical protein